MMNYAKNNNSNNNKKCFQKTLDIKMGQNLNEIPLDCVFGVGKWPRTNTKT